jgi:hypothetical protein
MDIGDLFDFDTLLVQLILALGAALLLGNGFAIWMDFTGRRPKSAQGEFRPGRAWFLASVGLVMTLWAIASLAI